MDARTELGIFLFSYASDKKQWWVTGFEPSTQDAKPSNLTAIFTIDFQNNKKMYDAFARSDDYLRDKTKRYSSSPVLKGDYFKTIADLNGGSNYDVVYTIV